MTWQTLLPSFSGWNTREISHLQFPTSESAYTQWHWLTPSKQLQKHMGFKSKTRISCLESKTFCSCSHLSPSSMLTSAFLSLSPLSSCVYHIQKHCMSCSSSYPHCIGPAAHRQPSCTNSWLLHRLGAKTQLKVNAFKKSRLLFLLLWQCCTRASIASGTHQAAPWDLCGTDLTLTAY